MVGELTFPLGKEKEKFSILTRVLKTIHYIIIIHHSMIIYESIIYIMDKTVCHYILTILLASWLVGN